MAKHTYQFTDSVPYLKMYRDSIFGETSLKCGWDCLRHYEILSQGTIPKFYNLETCPKNTLTTFPKTQVLHLMEKYGNSTFAEIMSNSSSILYQDLEDLLTYTRTHLTTTKAAEYILSKTDTPQTNRILFLSNGIKPGDYLEAMTMHGLFKRTDGNVDLYPNYDALYDSFPKEDLNTYYGKGFNYTRLLPASKKRSLSESEIYQKIKDREYDHILIYMHCMLQKDVPLLYGDTSVFKYYDLPEISLLCGKDCDDWSDGVGYYIRNHHNCILKVLSNQQNIFIRELGK